ncbi:MAG: methionyl-tRNA formyltransferase [Polyangiaceae bacterium]|nr:methionyl-tRNA formyltransferase [Polyangiaceae bacterium]
MPLKIAFFGLPLAALLLEHDGHDIALAAFCRTDSVGLRRAKRHFGSRAAIKPDATRPAFIQRVRDLKPDIVVSWFWTKRLPMDVVYAARFGGIGAHPSLLPRHRGPDPTFWAIRSGDTETGVSVHRLEADYDTGDVLAVERIAIDPTWNAWQLARALDRPSLRILRSTVAAFARGKPPPAVPQDPNLVTLAPAPTDDDCVLHWTKPTHELLRQVRALAPAPGAYTEIAGITVTVLAARTVSPFPAVMVPGEAAVFHSRCIVRTADGAVELLEVELDGEPASAAQLAELIHSAARSPD